MHLAMLCYGVHLVEKGDCHRDETLKRLQLSYFIIPQSAVWEVGRIQGKEVQPNRNGDPKLWHSNAMPKTITLAALIIYHTFSLNT